MNNTQYSAYIDFVILPDIEVSLIVHNQSSDITKVKNFILYFKNVTNAY